MPMAIRFHLDEHIDHDIARALRNRGIDVTTSADAELLSAPDEAHLAFALRESRVIFTHDPDFLASSSQGVAHAGIAFCASGSRNVGHIVRYLCLIHDCLESDEMRNRIEYL
jgi:predicted nuclease of predicted toxin-antitoxin system